MGVLVTVQDAPVTSAVPSAPADEASAPVGVPTSPRRPGGRSRRGEPTPYDFRRPTKLSRDHVRSMQMAMETFARHYSTLLTTTLRAVGQVTLESVQQVTYDEYVSDMATQTVLLVLDVEPLEGAGILQLDTQTAMVTLDHLLGGPGRLPQPDRPFTDIETQLITGIVERALHELRYALEPLVRIEPKLLAIEHNPQFLQAAASSDMMLVSTFTMKVGGSEGRATLCLPFSSVFPHLERATQNRIGTPDPEIRRNAEKALENRVSDLKVDVSVRFAPTTVELPTVLGLAPGDVLALRHPARSPLAVTAAGVTFAHAVPGSEGRRLACRVVASPQES